MLECAGAGGSGEPQCVKIRYQFIARNANELSVAQGELLEVLECDRHWWLLRNRSGQSGYVPCNVLDPAKPEHTHTGPSAAIFNTQVQNPYQASTPPVSLPYGGASQGSRAPPQHRDSRTQPTQREVNDELLKRISSSKAPPPGRNFRVERPACHLPLASQSQPHEVAAWLHAKGFSTPVVECLGTLTGEQLLSLSKEELRAVCGDEGSRAYSQLSVQRAQHESCRGNTELQEIMRRRQEALDSSSYN